MKMKEIPLCKGEEEEPRGRAELLLCAEICAAKAAAPPRPFFFFVFSLENMPWFPRKEKRSIFR